MFTTPSECCAELRRLCQQSQELCRTAFYNIRHSRALNSGGTDYYRQQLARYEQLLRRFEELQARIQLTYMVA